MLDLYRATADEIYLNRAYAVAETVLNYGIPRPEGLAFPGRMLLRISNDYGTGAAGIGMFLQRCRSRGPRRFMDLYDLSGQVHSRVASISPQSSPA